MSDLFTATSAKPHIDVPDFIELDPKSDFTCMFQISPTERKNLKAIQDYEKHRQDQQLFFNFADTISNPCIPISLANTPTETYAIPYFFRNHVLWQRDVDSQRGFLEILAQMYESSRPSSLLHKATYAVALGSMSNALKSRPMRCEARRTYGKALQELGVAIRNPNTAASDELLMAVLLFSLYEVSLVFQFLSQIPTPAN
jgi:hypothetical protein